MTENQELKKIMNTKTWKIGEYCRGGVITVTVNEYAVRVIGKEWDLSAGTTRGSSQKNAILRLGSKSHLLALGLRSRFKIFNLE